MTDKVLTARDLEAQVDGASLFLQKCSRTLRCALSLAASKPQVKSREMEVSGIAPFETAKGCTRPQRRRAAVVMVAILQYHSSYALPNTVRRPPASPPADGEYDMPAAFLRDPPSRE